MHTGSVSTVSVVTCDLFCVMQLGFLSQKKDICGREFLFSRASVVEGRKKC